MARAKLDGGQLLDPTFVLDGLQYDELVAMLDNPPAPSAELKKLLAERAPWEMDI